MLIDIQSSANIKLSQNFTKFYQIKLAFWHAWFAFVDLAFLDSASKI